MEKQEINKILADRFWSKVDIKSKDECWEWMAGLFSNGYGQFRVGKNKSRAHRISYELSNGPIPEGMLICHKCDNKKCVNPDHLFCGTVTDNNRDSVEKGRRDPVKNLKRFYGESHSMCKLTDEEVETIRNSYFLGNITQSQLGKRYGVSSSYISNIVRGKFRKRQGGIIQTDYSHRGVRGFYK